MKTIDDLLQLTTKIYGIGDDRLYDLTDLFYYQQKWLLRYIDDKKHGRRDSASGKLMVSLAWYFAIISRFRIDLQKLLEKRYSYKCPFCLEIPCDCQKSVRKKSQKTGRPVSGNPTSLAGWQKVIGKIYPAELIEFRNLEILRQQDVFHQTFRRFRQSSGKRNLHEIEIASADYFVELLKIANNLQIDIASEYFQFFSAGCFVCHSTPCECFYSE
ncbi:MAG: hypothetical protein NTY30_01745 [Candidatus Berkelbacteria bacterium]|nr:hypothetical protein [Candidatus Berkelbacteria bacterium]